MPRKVLKVIAFLLCFCLIFEQSGFAQVAAQLDISGHLNALRNSLFTEKFRPLHLRYLQYNPSANTFKLLLDKGSANSNGPNGLNEQTKELLKYFLIGVTLPNDTFWVNLRPDSPDNIIDQRLAQTDIGKILLEADLQLKKDTAQATSPQTPAGKEYWDKLYQKAEELFGYENVTIPTLTRPWIVPDEIIIRESSDNAYIYKATLKVLLEQDYLKDSATYNFTDPRLKALNEYSSQLIRELIIPTLTKEINNAKRYAPLRQVYYSLILSQWFRKSNHGQTVWGQSNFDSLKSQEPIDPYTYFQEYKASFEKGEYNVKQPHYTPFGQTIRSYFSGGIGLGENQIATATNAGLKLTTGPNVSDPLAWPNKNTETATAALNAQGEISGVVIGGGQVKPAPSLPEAPAQQQPLAAGQVNAPIIIRTSAMRRADHSGHAAAGAPEARPDPERDDLEARANRILQYIIDSDPSILESWFKNLGVTISLGQAKQVYLDIVYKASGEQKNTFRAVISDDAGYHKTFIFAFKTPKATSLFEPGELSMYQACQGSEYVPIVGGVVYVPKDFSKDKKPLLEPPAPGGENEYDTILAEEFIEGKTFEQTIDKNRGQDISIAKKCLVALMSVFFMLNPGSAETHGAASPRQFIGPTDFHRNNIIIDQNHPQERAVLVDLGAKSIYSNIGHYLCHIVYYYGGKSGDVLDALYEGKWPNGYDGSYWDKELTEAYNQLLIQMELFLDKHTVKEIWGGKYTKSDCNRTAKAIFAYLKHKRGITLADPYARFCHIGDVAVGAYDPATGEIYYDFARMRQAMPQASRAQAVNYLYLHEAFHQLLDSLDIEVSDEEILVQALAKEKVGLVLDAEESLALIEFRAAPSQILTPEARALFDHPALQNIGTSEDTLGDFLLKLQRALPGAAFHNVQGRDFTPEFVAELEAKGARFAQQDLPQAAGVPEIRASRIIFNKVLNLQVPREVVAELQKRLNRPASARVGYTLWGQEKIVPVPHSTREIRIMTTVPLKVEIVEGVDGRQYTNFYRHIDNRRQEYIITLPGAGPRSATELLSPELPRGPDIDTYTVTLCTDKGYSAKVNFWVSGGVAGPGALVSQVLPDGRVTQEASWNTLAVRLPESRKITEGQWRALNGQLENIARRFGRNADGSPTPVAQEALNLQQRLLTASVEQNGLITEGLLTEITEFLRQYPQASSPPIGNGGMSWNAVTEQIAKEAGQKVLAETELDQSGCEALGQAILNNADWLTSDLLQALGRNTFFMEQIRSAQGALGAGREKILKAMAQAGKAKPEGKIKQAIRKTILPVILGIVMAGGFFAGRMHQEQPVAVAPAPARFSPEQLAKKVTLLLHTHTHPFKIGRMRKALFNTFEIDAGPEGASSKMYRKNVATILNKNAAQVAVYKENIAAIKAALTDPKNPVKAIALEESKKELDAILKVDLNQRLQQLTEIMQKRGVENAEERAKDAALLLCHPVLYLSVTEPGLLKDVALVAADSEVKDRSLEVMQDFNRAVDDLTAYPIAAAQWMALTEKILKERYAPSEEEIARVSAAFGVEKAVEQAKAGIAACLEHNKVCQEREGVMAERIITAPGKHILFIVGAAHGIWLEAGIKGEGLKDVAFISGAEHTVSGHSASQLPRVTAPETRAIEVSLMGGLQNFAGGKKHLSVEAGTVRALLKEVLSNAFHLEEGSVKFQEMQKKICVLVNEQEVKDLDTPLNPGDEVTLIFVVSGGADTTPNSGMDQAAAGKIVPADVWSLINGKANALLGVLIATGREANVIEDGKVVSGRIVSATEADVAGRKVEINAWDLLLLNSGWVKENKIDILGQERVITELKPDLRLDGDMVNLPDVLVACILQKPKVDSALFWQAQDGGGILYILRGKDFYHYSNEFNEALGRWVFSEAKNGKETRQAWSEPGEIQGIVQGRNLEQVFGLLQACMQRGEERPGRQKPKAAPTLTPLQKAAKFKAQLNAQQRQIVCQVIRADAAFRPGEAGATELSDEEAERFLTMRESELFGRFLAEVIAKVPKDAKDAQTLKDAYREAWYDLLVKRAEVNLPVSAEQEGPSFTEALRVVFRGESLALSREMSLGPAGGNIADLRKLANRMRRVTHWAAQAMSQNGMTAQDIEACNKDIEELALRIVVSHEEAADKEEVVVDTQGINIPQAQEISSEIVKKLNRESRVAEARGWIRDCLRQNGMSEKELVDYSQRIEEFARRIVDIWTEALDKRNVIVDVTGVDIPRAETVGRDIRDRLNREVRVQLVIRWIGDALRGQKVKDKAIHRLQVKIDRFARRILDSYEAAPDKEKVEVDLSDIKIPYARTIREEIIKKLNAGAAIAQQQNGFSGVIRQHFEKQEPASLWVICIADDNPTHRQDAYLALERLCLVAKDESVINILADAFENLCNQKPGLIRKNALNRLRSLLKPGLSEESAGKVKRAVKAVAARLSPEDLAEEFGKSLNDQEEKIIAQVMRGPGADVINFSQRLAAAGGALSLQEVQGFLGLGQAELQGRWDTIYPKIFSVADPSKPFRYAEAWRELLVKRSLFSKEPQAGTEAPNAGMEGEPKAQPQGDFDNRIKLLIEVLTKRIERLDQRMARRRLTEAEVENRNKFLAQLPLVKETARKLQGADIDSIITELRRVKGGATKKLSARQKLTISAIKSMAKRHPEFEFNPGNIFFVTESSWLCDLFEFYNANGKMVRVSDGIRSADIILVRDGGRDIFALIKTLIHEHIHKRFMAARDAVSLDLWPIFAILNEAMVEQLSQEILEDEFRKNPALRRSLSSYASPVQLRVMAIFGTIPANIVAPRYIKERDLLDAILLRCGSEGQKAMEAFLKTGNPGLLEKILGDKIWESIVSIAYEIESPYSPLPECQPGVYMLARSLQDAQPLKALALGRLLISAIEKAEIPFLPVEAFEYPDIVGEIESYQLDHSIPEAAYELFEEMLRDPADGFSKPGKAEELAVQLSGRAEKLILKKISALKEAKTKSSRTGSEVLVYRTGPQPLKIKAINMEDLLKKLKIKVVRPEKMAIYKGGKRITIWHRKLQDGDKVYIIDIVSGRNDTTFQDSSDRVDVDGLDTTGSGPGATPKPNAGMEGVSSTPQDAKGGIDPALPNQELSDRFRKGGVDLRSLPIVTQPMAAPLPALSMNTRVPLSAQEAKELEEEFGAIEKMVAAGIIPSTDRLKDYLGNCYDKQGLDGSIDKVLACIADILRLEEERCLSTETALKELLQLLESDKPQEQFKLSLNAIKPLAQEVPGLDEFTYEDKRNE